MMNRRQRRKLFSSWSSKDDWGVPYVYVETILELLVLVENGADPAKLAAHAQHVRSDCEKAQCPPAWLDW